MKRLKDIVIGIIVGSIITTFGAVYASSNLQSIQVEFNKVNLKVNGQSVPANNILYNGTTYIPIRAVANMFEKEVGWNSTSNTASINDKTYKEPTNIESVKEGETVINEFIKGSDLIESENGKIIIIKSTGETYYEALYVLSLMNGKSKTNETYGVDRDKFTKDNTIRFYYNFNNKTLIENVPYRKINLMPFIAKDYYENTILPLINK